ncbi:alpha/beta fold hydrolase [Rugosimonospora acidiphila]|uniref:Alpha/beta fold hydrolase n=1 Tax=Rugosimonospora acidiphila TaxID=556531 RepID=A0ABP9RRT6_9ACTN
MAGNRDTGDDPGTIVLIHGLWLTPRSWEHWVDRYRAAGFEVLAPAWPGLDVEVEALREDSSPLERLDIPQIVDHYHGIIEPMRRPPIIMGHGIGGTFTQILLDHGLGAAGVAIDSASVFGVLRQPMAMLKSVAAVLRNPVNTQRAVSMTAQEFHQTVANALPEQESMAAYQRYYVPAAGRIVFEADLANFDPRRHTKVNFGRSDRAPLLFIVGDEDRVSPPQLNFDNANHYRKSTAVTDVKEYPGRCHFTLGQQGWEDVADYALNWSLEEARAQHALKNA